MRIKSRPFHLIIFFLLSCFALPAIACPPPDCGDCCHWVSTGEEPDDGYCELNTGAECGACSGCTGECVSCNSCSCESDCSPTQSCCNDTCCASGENCCDGITCYDPATETCCGDGYGTVCSGSFPCCLDVPGLASICTNYCHDSVCCSSGQWCCDSVCCDYPCCGTEGCCGAPNYCCGDPSWNELCCDADEVCCWSDDGMGGFVYYCNPPCTDEVTDPTICSEDNEDFYKCTGCKQVVGPTCSPSTSRDYSGLEISTCYDGCPQFDHNTSNEICYEVKNCFGMFEADSLCMECEGEKSCFPVVEFGEPSECKTIGECVTQVACDIVFTCFQCTAVEIVSDTVYEETCQCN